MSDHSTDDSYSSDTDSEYNDNVSPSKEQELGSAQPRQRTVPHERREPRDRHQPRRNSSINSASRHSTGSGSGSDTGHRTRSRSKHEPSKQHSSEQRPPRPTTSSPHQHNKPKR